MTNPYFSTIDCWRIPEGAIPRSLEEMAQDGESGNEGIVLFLGHHQQLTAEITHLIGLRGPGIQKFPNLINIYPPLLNDVTDLALELKVRLIGQVHSHAPECGVDLSRTDRTYGIRAPYFLSLVAPDYALSHASIDSWGIHVFMEAKGYVRLSREGVNRRIKVVPGATIPFITVGDHHGS
jgi:hypothetical protein